MTEITGVHPYADRFPMLPADELEELVASVAANGLRNPVVVTPDGLILDGRNRFAACIKLGLEAETVTYEGTDLAEYVIDCNTTRRHLTTGQRAMASALVLADDGRREGGRWQYGTGDFAPVQDSTFKSQLSRCGVILDYAPEFAPEVVAGDLPLKTAFQQADELRRSAESDELRRKAEEKRKREEAKAKAEREAKIIADLTELGSSYVALIEDGTLTPPAAWAAHLEDTRKEREAESMRRQNAERHCRDFANALDVLWSVAVPEERHRSIHELWPIGADGARPAARERRTPKALRELAAVLSTYADEMESR